MVLRSKSGEYTVTRGTRGEHHAGEHGRAAAVCLGLLCLLLLSTVIGLVAHYNKSDCNLAREREELQTSLNSMSQERTQLQTSLNNLTQERNQLQTSLNSTTQEKNQLQMEIERLTLNIKELTSQICPDGWTKFNSSCYFKSSESKSWNESRQDCLRRGADLVIINSREEHSFLKKFGLRVWIGLSDLETEGEWKWLDGSSLSYRSWAKGQPDDHGGKEDCGELRPAEDGWNDVFCSDGRPWICEKKDSVHPVGI